MRRAVLPAALLAAVAAGCGGPHRSHSVRDVERAFYGAGLPFRSETRPNPYLTGNDVFVPRSLQPHVEALLGRTDSVHFTVVLAWVFDSDASARRAVTEKPLRSWLQGNPKIVRRRLGNVIVAGSGTPAQLVRLRRALASLG